MEYNSEQVRCCVYCNKPIAFRDVQHKRGHDFGSPIRKCQNCGKEFVDYEIYELACKVPFGFYASKHPVVFGLMILSLIVAATGYCMKDTSIAIGAVVISVLSVTYVCTYVKKHIFDDDVFMMDELVESKKRLSDVKYAKRLHKAGYHVPRKYWAIKDDTEEIIVKEEKFQVTQEWLTKTLEEIDKLNPDNAVEKKKEDVCYSIDPEDDIRYSINVNLDDIDLWPDDEAFNGFAQWSKKVEKPTFQKELLRYIAESGMTNAQFYKAALIDRKLFSAINKNVDYKPKKETAVACCFALKLSIFDAEDLLELAGYSLSMAIPWDRAVYYCIKNYIYDLDLVNHVLYAMGEKPLRL